MVDWRTSPKEDGSHHAENANIACQELGLDPSFRSALHDVILQWEKETSAGYLEHLVRPGILNLCKSPDDFRQASTILLKYFKKIWEQADGSVSFAQAIFAEIKAGRITSLQVLEHVCKSVFEQNEAFRATKEGIKVGRRSGEQYPEYVATVMREALEKRTGMKL